jgi:hypothetical protein
MNNNDLHKFLTTEVYDLASRVGSLASARRVDRTQISNILSVYEAIFNNWNFWNEYLSLDERIEFTEDFCKNVSVILSENKVYDVLLSESKLKTSDIVIVRFDFSSIQSYIWLNDIRTLMGGTSLRKLVSCILHFRASKKLK